MKKSTLLSFVTAGAIVATSAGTFAAWDTLDANKDITLTYGKPVVVELGTVTNPTDALGGIDGQSSVTASIPVTIKSDTADYATLSDKKITLEATGTDVDKLNIVFKDAGTALTNGVDESPTADKTYTAEISLKDANTAIAAPTTINVKATLAKK